MPRPMVDMPSIEELRQQTMSAKPDARWWYRMFRHVSVYLTWALLHTRVTPNQVTVASLFSAAVGLLLLAQASVGVALVGIALLVWYHMLDRVDGEIARARTLHSLRGIYLDNSGHFFSEGGVFVAITYRLSGTSLQVRDLWLVGACGALAAVLTRMAKHAPFQLFSQYVMDRPSLVSTKPRRGEIDQLTREATRSERHGDQPSSIVGAVRGFVLAWTSFPATILLFATGLVVELAWHRTDVLTWILIGAAVLRMLVYVAVELINLGGNLDAESRRLAELNRRDA